MTDQSDELSELFDGVERRAAPHQQAKDQAYAAVFGEWESLQHKRKNTKRQRFIALAASIVMAVGTVVLWQQHTTPLAIKMVQGTVALEDNKLISSDNKSVDWPQDVIISSVEASRWLIDDNIDVRLSKDAQVQWHSSNGLSLLHGSVYVATSDNASFTVDTSFGQVTDIGTRFIVSATDSEVEVAVREGQIEFDTPHGTYKSEITSREQATLTRVTNDGVEQHTDKSSAERWQWINEVPKGYLSKKPITLLQLIAQDMGKNVSIDSRTLKLSLDVMIIEGRFENLSPENALKLLAKSAGFRWQIIEHQIVITPLVQTL